MATVGIGPMELLLLAALLFGGGGLSGVGVPLPPDAGLQGAAPPECLVYLSHYGSGRPDPNSTNHVERLLAEPAIGAFASELNRLAEEAVELLPAGDEPAATAVKTLPVLVRALAERPNMLYVASAAVPPAAPDVRAAFVVAADRDAPALRDALLSWERLYLQQLGQNAEATVTQVGTAELRRLPMPPDVPPMVPPVVPPVVWGVDGGYVFLTIGEDEAQELSKRLAARGPPPPWLKQLEADAAIPRPAAVAYVNVSGVMRVVDPLINQFAAFAPFDVRKIIDESGLPQIRYLAAAVGLDDSTSVTKLLVGHEADAAGVLALLDRAPLTKVDFADVPRVADFAAVARCDAAAAYRRLLDLVGAVEPRALEEWRRETAQAEEELGFGIERDLLAGLGDRWTIYNSPTEGGSLLTGVCAVAAIRDRAKAEGVIERILKVLADETGRGGRPGFVVNKLAVGERTISYLQFLAEPVPVAPAWCLTDDRLVFALSPQMVEIHLSRAADAPTLADAPEVAGQLAAGDVLALVYADGRSTAALAYSYVQYLATMGAGMLAKETGLRADLSKFPPYTAIGPHLQPSVSVIRRRKTVSSFESYSVGPALGPVAPLVGAGASLALFGVREARQTAREIHATNNLRMLTLAAFNYAVEKNEPMPPAVRSADGKPLLSWRVALLPYLDQQELYDQFHLDEPWDSEHNQRLQNRMPSFYQHPAVAAAPGFTVFQLPRGKGTLYENDRASTEAEIDALPIGRGQTVLFVEAAADRTVPWTKPADVELTPDTLFQRLYVQADGEIQAAMNDGSIVNLSTMLDRELLLPMFFPRSSR